MKEQNPNPRRCELLAPFVSLLLFDSTTPDFIPSFPNKLTKSYFKCKNEPNILVSLDFVYKLDLFFKSLTTSQRDELVMQLLKSEKFLFVYSGNKVLTKSIIPTLDLEAYFNSLESLCAEMKAFKNDGNVRDFMVIYFALDFEYLFHHNFKEPGYVSEEEYKNVLEEYTIIH